MAPAIRTHPGGVPVTSTPPRRPRSVRRTTTHDCARPNGLSGRVVAAARGRDLLTTAEGRAIVLDATRIDVTMEDYFKGVLTTITSDPPYAGIAKLAGINAFAGFRPTVEAALPGESASHGVRFQLLDELPAALLQSGRALRAAGIGIKMEGRKVPVDICAGWAEGGTLLTGLSEFGPPLLPGPAAPAIEPDNDPLAWHEITPLAPHDTRRRRRLDLWEENGCIRVECFFRDSHADGEGIETVVHEWTLQAALDPKTRCFLSGAARMGPLPYPECPGSMASAGRLAGMPIDGLRRAVRTSFVGPSTCTHLNDTMRSMEDVGALLDALSRAQDAP